MSTMNKVYMDAQAACGLKVGDYVRVIRKAKDFEAGWSNTWNPDMDQCVGHIGEISRITAENITVELEKPYKYQWNFPYFTLEKVDKPIHQFKPFEPVLVRDNDRDIWKCNCFSHVSNDLYWVFGSVYSQCIPYEGNEHLVGSTEKPEWVTE